MSAAQRSARLLLVDDDQAITDAVVLDVMLPGMDGRAVLRELRAAGRTVPVVLLTSVGEASERARALDEGADDYLNKPFDAGELASRVRAVLRRAERGGRTHLGVVERGEVRNPWGGGFRRVGALPAGHARASPGWG